MRGSLTIAASLVEEHRLQTLRLSSCGSRAQSLRGMWDLPRPGLEPVSPALAGRFSTAAPPGKPPSPLLMIIVHALPQLNNWSILLLSAHTCDAGNRRIPSCHKGAGNTSESPGEDDSVIPGSRSYAELAGNTVNYVQINISIKPPLNVITKATSSQSDPQTAQPTPVDSCPSPGVMESCEITHRNHLVLRTT